MNLEGHNLDTSLGRHAKHHPGTCSLPGSFGRGFSFPANAPVVAHMRSRSAGFEYNPYGDPCAVRAGVALRIAGMLSSDATIMKSTAPHASKAVSLPSSIPQGKVSMDHARSAYSSWSLRPLTGRHLWIGAGLSGSAPFGFLYAPFDRWIVHEPDTKKRVGIRTGISFPSVYHINRVDSAKATESGRLGFFLSRRVAASPLRKPRMLRAIQGRDPISPKPTGRTQRHSLKIHATQVTQQCAVVRWVPFLIGATWCSGWSVNTNRRVFKSLKRQHSSGRAAGRETGHRHETPAVSEGAVTGGRDRGHPVRGTEDRRLSGDADAGRLPGTAPLPVELDAGRGFETHLCQFSLHTPRIQMIRGRDRSS